MYCVLYRLRRRTPLPFFGNAASGHQYNPPHLDLFRMPIPPVSTRGGGGKGVVAKTNWKRRTASPSFLATIRINLLPKQFIHHHSQYDSAWAVTTSLFACERQGPPTSGDSSSLNLNRYFVQTPYSTRSALDVFMLNRVSPSQSSLYSVLRTPSNLN